MKLELFVLLSVVALTSQTDGGENAVEETASTEESTVEPETTTVAEEVVRTEPSNMWGSYSNLDLIKFQDLFNKAFVKFASSDARGDSECRAPGNSEAMFNRYYKELTGGGISRYILSYECRVSREYEHILVKNVNVDADPVTGEYVAWYASLKGLGITADKYHKDNTMSEADAEAFVEETFGLVEDQISANLPDYCKDPAFNTEIFVKTKTENQLHYWKFPVTCTEETKDDRYVDVEVYKDEENNWVNDGEYTLATRGPLMSNRPYFLIKEMEAEKERALQEEAEKERARQEADGEPDQETALQKGGSEVFVLSLALVPFARLLL